MAKSKSAAREMLRNYNVPLDQNFFSLDSETVSRVVEAGKTYGYRKRKDAPGSYARMFYQYACR